jgi:hypothetical protein
MSGLARHLQARGHDVVFLYSSSANGLPCIPGDKRDDLNANRPEMSQLRGFSPSWLILLSFRKSSISNTLYYLHSFITPVRFMMARAGTQWIFLGTD